MSSARQAPGPGVTRNATGQHAGPEGMDALAEFVWRHAGLDLPTDPGVTQERLQELMQQLGVTSLSGLVKAGRNDSSGGVQQGILDALEVQESSWFRDEETFAVLRDKIFPRLREVESGTLHLWSAACSQGQEPYSLSMLVEEAEVVGEGTGDPDGGEVHILATDVSGPALFTAQSGCYSAWEIDQGIETRQRERFFEQRGGRFQVKSEIRRRVNFRQVDLLKPQMSDTAFHLVMLRNLLGDFSPERRAQVLEAIAQRLHPEGFLVGGAHDFIEDYSPCFRHEVVGGIPVYRRV